MKTEETLDNPTQAPQEDYGFIEVADEVISIVASLAATEVPGVVEMSGGFADGISKLLGKNTLAQGVRVKVEGKMVVVVVYIIVEYGTCVPELALTVQEKIKDAIEAMTEYEVKYVDVHIQGVKKRPRSALEMNFENLGQENFKAKIESVLENSDIAQNINEEPVVIVTDSVDDKITEEEKTNGDN